MTAGNTDSMIWNAESSQLVVKELERHGSESWASDPFVFQGTGLAEAILLSRAIEITLRGPWCREPKDAPDLIHDLLDMF